MDIDFLKDVGKISHIEALEKARLEYKKYQVKEFNSIEREYLNSINKINKTINNLEKGQKK